LSAIIGSRKGCDEIVSSNENTTNADNAIVYDRDLPI